MEASQARPRVSYAARDGYLYARCEALQLLERVPLVFRAIAAEAASTGHGRVLIDFRATTGQLAQHEQLQMANIAIAALAGLRVAFVIDAPRRTGVLPGAAASQGLQCAGFSEEELAVAWLMDERSPVFVRRS